MHKFVATLQKIESQVWYTGFLVPNDIGEILTQDGEKRVMCSINGNKTFHAALLPYGNGSFFILVNKERQKKLKLIEGCELQITLEKDTSKYGMPMPEEMEELLAQDPEGNVLFHKLTMGKQRSLLHIIGKPKSTNIRLNKALTIVNYLKSTGGKLDFKELNVAFKENKF